MGTRALVGSTIAAVGLAMAAPAAADFIDTPVCTLPTRVIQWDVQALLDEGSSIDARPGAIFVDVNSSTSGGTDHPVWFVTTALNPRVYRLDTRHKKSVAPATSWELAPDSLTTGGLKKVHVTGDRRFIAVQTASSLQFVDTQKCAGTDPNQTCERLEFRDRVLPTPFSLSDVATDSRYNVFTAVSPAGEDGFTVVPENSYVQRLSLGSLARGTDKVTASVTRWPVGDGAGACDSGVGPCIAGIAVSRRNPALVYYSATLTDQIVELNTQTNPAKLRRFPLSALNSTDDPNPAAQPRQLDVDEEGVVWVVTGSGHLVRLDPERKLMSKHLAPPDLVNDLFGVAIDRGGHRGKGDRDEFRNEYVGYTNAGGDQVGLLIPDGKLVPVTPIVDSVTPQSDVVLATPEPARVARLEATPREQMRFSQLRRQPDGTYVEEQLPAPESMSPLGITPDKKGKIGTFFYAVGATDAVGVQRIEKVTFPRLERRPDNPRDHDDFDDDGKRDHDDDDIDDDGVMNAADNDNDNDCVADTVDDDDDNDGLEDTHDRRDRDERKSTERATANGGSTQSYPVTVASGTTLLTVLASAADLAAPLSIEIVDPLGVVVSKTLPTPGAGVATVVPLKAGTYTVRVKNNGLTATNVETTTITESLPLL